MEIIRFATFESFFALLIYSLPFVKGYGLTESTANGAVIDRDDLTLGSVGTPLLGVDFKLVSWKEGGYLVTNESGPQG